MESETLEAPVSTVAAPEIPYPGLRPFEESESRFFFGREAESGAILTRLEEQQLVVVHGASGCGKSSLVRAGVIPIFRMDCLACDREPRVIVVRPSDRGSTLASLAAALEKEFPRDAAPAGSSPDRLDGDAWARVLVSSPDWAAAIRAAADSSGSTLCLVIDQFEEIFTLHRGEQAAEIERLIEFLISLDEPSRPGAALGERPISVILTMRSDYLGHCSLWEGFAETVNRCQYLLPKISQMGLLRAIHEPALRCGGEVDEAVADHLLPIVEGEIDGLPVLQHALMRCWQLAVRDPDRPRAITLNQLEQAGGASGALSKHAEAAFERATRRDLQREVAASWLFRSLCELDVDGRIVRRSRTVAQLADEAGVGTEWIREIVNVFRAREFSLLSPYPPKRLRDSSIVSISHEALLRRWGRISDPGFDEDGRPSGLAYREAEDGMIWRALSVQAKDFAKNNERVLSSAATEQRLPWFREIEKRPGWTCRYQAAGCRGSDGERSEEWQLVTALMAASESHLKQEQKKLEEQRALVTKLKKFQGAVAALTVLIVLIVGVVAAEYVATVRVDNEAAKRAAEVASVAAADAELRLRQTHWQVAGDLARRECHGRGNQQGLEECLARSQMRFSNELRNGRGNVRPTDVPSQEEMERVAPGRQ